MKAGNHARANRATRPEKNQNSKLMLAAVLGIVAVMLIIWVWALGSKADQTISVCMYAEDIYKNETITEDMFKEYKMTKVEYEKYTIVEEDGTKYRRILLWEERGDAVGTFAAYNCQAETICMNSDFINSRVTNSDTVLYSYPGKVVTALDVGDSDLESFKSLLQPGDKVNIIAIFKKQQKLTASDALGNTDTQTVELQQTETMFEDIMLADMLNNDGDSILDLYEYYDNLSVYAQAQLDSDESWKERTTPSKILLALTPEELDTYYYYLGKDCQFRMTLNQRNS